MFRRKKFNVQEYASMLEEIEGIWHAICIEKLESVESVVDRMSKVLTDMGKEVGGLIKNQLTDISSVERVTKDISSSLQSGDPASKTLSMVDELDGYCKALMTNALQVQKNLLFLFHLRLLRTCSRSLVGCKCPEMAHFRFD